MAPPEFSITLFFSRHTVFTASATDEVGTSTTMSTPSRSNHWRTMPAPMSGLFWWSATSTSTSKPWSPNSCTACRTQTAPVGPPSSR